MNYFRANLSKKQFDMVAERIKVLLQLREYLETEADEWKAVCTLAERNNGWFTQAFISTAVQNICQQFLQEDELIVLASMYKPFSPETDSKIVGITMAGNIPMVGFHDFLCVFMSGHTLHIKLSTKDEILMKHIIQKICIWYPPARKQIQILPLLKNCDAYIATGSNQTAQLFEQYFAKYPHIIRKNRTSVAVLTGNETDAELSALANDIYTFFGLGCRNVTKIYVPENYAFEQLLTAGRKFDALKNHHKYRNNIDYNLALYILNNQFYMSNESLILAEHTSNFSPIGVLHYSFYADRKNLLDTLQHDDTIQAIIGQDLIPFGEAQRPTLTDFADGVNTIEFLNSLS